MVVMQKVFTDSYTYIHVNVYIDGMYCAFVSGNVFAA